MLNMCCGETFVIMTAEIMGDEKDNEEAGAKRQRLKGFFYETPP